MAEDLQFERADYSAPRAMACSACKAAILTEYYAANGQVLCAACAEGMRQHLAGPGLGVSRFGQAILFGLGAAIAGAAVYGGIMLVSGMNLALVSIAVGWFVGKAVRHGSKGRGGWRYQALAALLTYLAVCGAYAVLFWPAFKEHGANGVLFLTLNLYRLPVLDGFTSPLRPLIIGFGVWQAWKMNQPLQVEITGPHAIGTGPQPTPAAGA